MRRGTGKEKGGIGKKVDMIIWSVEISIGLIWKYTVLTAWRGSRA